MIDPVRAALAELVRLKDMKKRIEHLGGLPVSVSGEEYVRLTTEYLAGKDAAWAEARRVLAPVEAVTPALAIWRRMGEAKPQPEACPNATQPHACGDAKCFLLRACRKQATK